LGKFGLTAKGNMKLRATIGSLVAAALLLLTASCTDEGGVVVIDKTQRDSLALGDSVSPVPGVDKELLLRCQPVDGFDYPVGPPDAKSYFKARGFLGMEHLGEDWNGTGGGNSDFGDFVYAVADGVVYAAEDHGEGWGFVIRMMHNIGTADSAIYIESVYAHVASSWVKAGNKMKRGEVLGTIGTAEGKYHAHLHFEMRGQPGKHISSGYAGDTAGFINPTPFIEAHRPKR
jgi:hypothetical protein